MIAGVSITTLLLVLVAGIGAGFVGYAVGASSLISYPALLAFGIPPVLSNTTNTVGVCGTGIGVSLAADKVAGIRASSITSPEHRLGRRHRRRLAAVGIAREGLRIRCAAAHPVERAYHRAQPT